MKAVIFWRVKVKSASETLSIRHEVIHALSSPTGVVIPAYFWRESRRNSAGPPIKHSGATVLRLIFKGAHQATKTGKRTRNAIRINAIFLLRDLRELRGDIGTHRVRLLPAMLSMPIWRMIRPGLTRCPERTRRRRGQAPSQLTSSCKIPLTHWIKRRNYP